MPTKYIIVEDEPLALMLLKNLAARMRPDWELLFTGGSVMEVMDYFSKGGEADLCFMDIELSDGNIFTLFRNMRLDIPVIFTTAYDSYCLEAFKANSVSYVLKPIDESELKEAIEKYERMWTHTRQKQATSEIEAILRKMAEAKEPDKTERILTSVGDRFGYVNIPDVAWFVSEDKYVYAITHTGKKELTVLRTLLEVEDAVSDKTFFRLSRRLICSITSIENISRYFKGRLNVRLRAGDIVTEETVSSDRRNEFLNWVGKGSV